MVPVKGEDADFNVKGPTVPSLTLMQEGGILQDLTRDPT